MVLAHHLIWTAYGWWLPHDPRESNSFEVRVERIQDLGELHHGRKPTQPPGRVIRAFYHQAAERTQACERNPTRSGAAPDGRCS